jgi:lipopolysaccharide/colanic/teichoic acid biosynthesis glycosyltransferase
LTTRGLAIAIERGARLRRGRFSRRFATIALPTGMIAVLNLLAYYALANRTGALDLGDAAPTLVVMFCVPIVVSLAIAGLNRDRFPLSRVILWSVAVFVMATAGLSAARLTVSYSSILSCCLISTVAMSSIAARLWAGWQERVAILAFDGARELEKRIGPQAEIVRVASAELGDADVVLIDVHAHHGTEWADFLARAYTRGVSVMPWRKYLEVRFGRTDVDSFDVAEIAYTSSQASYAHAKRVFDLVVVLLVAPLWVPLFAAIAAYVLAVAGGPIIFRHVRRGHGEEDFTLYKFRTMQHGCDHAPVASGDRRIIRALAWLRRTRLDELPQLINVLRGEMSLVGPRPESLEIARRYEAALPQYVDRRLVLPGITGWAQVNVRASSSVDEALEKLAFDLYYVKHLSADLDLLILAKTVKALFTLAPAG